MGAASARAHSQEPLMGTFSVPHSGCLREAPSHAQHSTASGPRDSHSRLDQHYVGAVGSSGAAGPCAGPATALLPGSHQPQLQQCFPERWHICLCCFA